MEFLKVSSKSSPSSVAGAIAGMIKDGVPVEIQSVGAGAVNQAVKAIAISRGFLAPIGIEVVCSPSFADIDINGEIRTAIRFTVEPRYLRGVTLFGHEAEVDPDMGVIGGANLVGTRFVEH
jgi:stage V sporulation protein S